MEMKDNSQPTNAGIDSQPPIIEEAGASTQVVTKLESPLAKDSNRELTEAQSAVKSARVAAFAALIVAALSLLGTIYSSYQSRSSAVELASLKNTYDLELASLTRKAAAADKNRERYAEALRKANQSIRGMKDALQRAIDGKTTTLGEAEKILEPAANALLNSHRDHKDDVSGVDTSLGQRFHDAKNYGEGAYIHIRDKGPKSRLLSQDTQNTLRDARKKLLEVEEVIQLKYLWLTSSAGSN